MYVCVLLIFSCEATLETAYVCPYVCMYVLVPDSGSNCSYRWSARVKALAKGRFQKKKKKKLMEFSIKLAGWVLDAPVFH